MGNSLVKILARSTSLGLGSLSLCLQYLVGLWALSLWTLKPCCCLLLVVTSLLQLQTFKPNLRKENDAKMNRTANRPLPSGRMSVRAAWFWSILAGIVGITCLYQLNSIAALLGIIALFLYSFVYTPLKSRTSLCVFVGAIPGALPPMIGYVAATGDFSIEPGVLFAVQFMWQFPFLGYSMDSRRGLQKSRLQDVTIRSGH